MTTNQQISEKLDHLIHMLTQVIEYQKHTTILPLIKQITMLSTLFEKLPKIINNSETVSTEKIIVELKDISKQLSTIILKQISEKGKENINEEVYVDIWP